MVKPIENLSNFVQARIKQITADVERFPKLFNIVCRFILESWTFFIVCTHILVCNVPASVLCC